MVVNTARLNMEDELRQRSTPVDVISLTKTINNILFESYFYVF